MSKPLELGGPTVTKDYRFGSVTTQFETENKSGETIHNIEGASYEAPKSSTIAKDQGFVEIKRRNVNTGEGYNHRFTSKKTADKFGELIASHEAQHAQAARSKQAA